MGFIGSKETYVGKFVSPPDYPHYALVIRIALMDAQRHEFLGRNCRAVRSEPSPSICKIYLGRDIAASLPLLTCGQALVDAQLCHERFITEA